MFSHQRLLILLLFLSAVAFSQSSFWSSNATAAISSAKDSSAVTLGLKFYSDVPGKVTGVRFLKGRYDTGPHVGQLWSATGTLLGSVNFSNETASGWQYANFSSPISIAAKTGYVISYSTPNGRYAINTNYSWSSLSASPLHVQGSSPGVYRYGSGSRFPTYSWASSNYWVDLVFVPDGATAPPKVEISVAPQTVSLYGGRTQQFEASVSGTTNTNVTWTISPQVGSITTSGLYTAPATVSSEQLVTVTARSVSDSTKAASAGVSLLPGTPPSVSEVSFWNSQATPTNAQATSDQKPVTLGIRFTSEVPGKVLGVRFYKGPNNSGVHVANLWSTSGTNLGELTFANETGSGWQEGYFVTPILISSNTTYIASYFAPNGRYAYDQYFNWPSVSASPLRISGSNPGVYRYNATTAYPSSTWKSTNYWVDVIFQPDSATEPSPPATYSISGNISGSAATVTLSGPASATTATNSSGNYSFTGLDNGLYVVVPSKAGYEFSPSSASVTLNSASVSGINFTAAALPPAPSSVTLNWSASPSPNVVGYNLYRSTSSGGPYSKINPSPISGTSYVDSNVSTAPAYYYVATAVDSSGLESTFSNQAAAPME